MSDADIADRRSTPSPRAVGAAQEIGFDAVEDPRRARGYLVDQFFWDGANKRDDTWGGDFVQRTRFAADIVKVIRARVGGIIRSSFGSRSGNSRTSRRGLR